jgi:hypothetical protein
VPTISYRLHYGQSQTPGLEIIPDPTGLYRIAWPRYWFVGFSKPDRAALSGRSISVWRKGPICQWFNV